MISVLLFIVLIPNSLAIINTTFGGASNPSLIPSDYNASCGNLIDGTLANPCNNLSTWRNYSTASKIRIDVGVNSVNCTVTAGGGSGGGDNAARFYTGGLYNKIPKGYCVDFKIGIVGASMGSGTSIQVIWSPDVTGSTTATRIWANYGTAPAFCGAGDSFWNIGTALCTGTATTAQLPTDVNVTNNYQNVTFCQNSTTINGIVYFNNSDVLSTSQGANAETNTGNLTFYCQDGGASVAGDQLSIKDIFVYPQTGAAQAALPPEVPPAYDPIAMHLNGTETIRGFKTFLNNTVFSIVNITIATIDNIFGGNFSGNKIQANNLNITTISSMTNDNILLMGNLNISGNLNLTGSIGATRFTGNIDCSKIDGGSDSDYCADATGTIIIPRQIVMWRSDIQATGTANQGLNLPAAVTILDSIANGSCQKIDFTNDIGSELRCDVSQRTLVAATGLVINVSLRYLENNTGGGNSVLCQRRNQGAVAKANLNISNGSNSEGIWFTKPSWFNGNKTLCIYTAGGNAAADFTFPYINLWTR